MYRKLTTWILQLAVAGLAMAAILVLRPGAGNTDTLHATDDTYVDLVLTGENFGTNPNLVIQNVNIGKKGGENEVFVKFDLSPLLDDATGDPLVEEIDKATLRLWVEQVQVAGSVELHRVDGSWDESTLSASSAPATTFLDNVAISLADEKHFVTVDVTDVVQDWLDGTEPNNGIALLPYVTDVKVRLDSKENSQTSHPMEIEVALVGQVGIPGYEIVTGGVSSPARTKVFWNVPCPADKKVLGGGFSVDEGQRILLSAPSASGDKWNLGVKNLTVNRLGGGGFAICAFVQ